MLCAVINRPQLASSSAHHYRLQHWLLAQFESLALAHCILILYQVTTVISTSCPYSTTQRYFVVVVVPLLLVPSVPQKMVCIYLCEVMALRYLAWSQLPPVSPLADLFSSYGMTLDFKSKISYQKRKCKNNLRMIVCEKT